MKNIFKMINFLFITDKFEIFRLLHHNRRLIVISFARSERSLELFSVPPERLLVAPWQRELAIVHLENSFLLFEYLNKYSIFLIKNKYI